ncbi:hypothetical protein WDU94_015553 [Cyamophila willieti]
MPTSESEPQREGINYCGFCNSKIQRFSEHMFRKHKTHDEVTQIWELKAKSSERKKAMEALRMEHIKLNNAKGASPIVARRLKDGESADVMSACKYCSILFRKKILHRHENKCGLKPDVTGQGNLDGILKIMANGHKDDLYQQILKDDTFLQFGKFLMDNKGQGEEDSDSEGEDTEIDMKTQNVIREKLRQMARIKMRMEEIEKLEISLVDIFKKCNWDIFKAAVFNESGIGKKKTSLRP